MDGRMSCTLLLHSTTGNTRLVARRAQQILERLGHDCALHDIVRQPGPPDLRDTDLLLVAAPTMYFRPSMAMERFIEQLAPVAGAPRPALLLGTASGDPGAHFELQATQLRRKGWVTLGAHWLMMPTNWPPHRRVAGPFRLARPVAERIARLAPGSRALLAITWPDLGVPGPGAPRRLEAFLNTMLERAAGADLAAAPAPNRLPTGLSAFAELGRRIDDRMMRKATDPRIDAGRCSRCGTCVSVCPVGCITRADERSVPTVGEGCTGCWACFNHCPDGAIACWFSPGGRNQYRGPAWPLRRLFRDSE